MGHASAAQPARSAGRVDRGHGPEPAAEDAGGCSNWAQCSARARAHSPAIVATAGSTRNGNDSGNRKRVIHVGKGSCSRATRASAALEDEAGTALPARPRSAAGGKGGLVAWAWAFLAQISPTFCQHAAGTPRIASNTPEA